MDIPFIRRKTLRKCTELGCQCVSKRDGGRFLFPIRRENKYNFWSKYYKKVEQWYICRICGRASYYKIFNKGE